MKDNIIIVLAGYFAFSIIWLCGITADCKPQYKVKEGWLSAGPLLNKSKWLRPQVIIPSTK